MEKKFKKSVNCLTFKPKSFSRKMLWGSKRHIGFFWLVSSLQQLIIFFSFWISWSSNSFHLRFTWCDGEVWSIIPAYITQEISTKDDSLNPIKEPLVQCTKSFLFFKTCLLLAPGHKDYKGTKFPAQIQRPFSNPRLRLLQTPFSRLNPWARTQSTRDFVRTGPS